MKKFSNIQQSASSYCLAWQSRSDQSFFWSSWNSISALQSCFPFLVVLLSWETRQSALPIRGITAVPSRFACTRKILEHSSKRFLLHFFQICLFRPRIRGRNKEFQHRLCWPAPCGDSGGGAGVYLGVGSASVALIWSPVSSGEGVSEQTKLPRGQPEP